MFRRMASLIGLAFLFLAGPIRSYAQDLYVASTEGKVFRVDQTGKASVFASAGLSEPYGITVSSAGDFYVANFGNNSISKISPTGAVSNFSLTGDRLNKPVCLAFSSSGDLYVSNFGTGDIGKGSISKISPTGVVSTWVAGLTAPAGLAFAPNGDLYVTNYAGGISTGIYRITQAKEVSNYVPTGALDMPFGIVFSGEDLLITNYGNGRILRKASDEPPSLLVQNFPLIGRAMGIVAKEKHYYVANMIKGTVVKISPVIGSPTPSVTIFASGIKNATGIVLK